MLLLSWLSDRALFPPPPSSPSEMIYSWPTKCECTLVFVGFVKHLNNSNNFCPAPGCCAPPPVPTGRLLSIHMNILSCKFSLIWHSSVAPFFRSPYGMFVFWSPLARIVSHKCLILWPGYCSPSCPPDQHFITCANFWISYSQDDPIRNSTSTAKHTSSSSSVPGINFGQSRQNVRIFIYCC